MERHLRLDDLAREAGVPTTTVRLYQAKGLLDRPRLEGRTGWYDGSHLARLRLISRLQDSGFSLSAIAQLVQAWEEGRDLDDLVGAEAQLDSLLGSRYAIVLDPSDLAARFPAGMMTPELVQRALALGLIEPAADGRVRVPDRRFLDTGSALARLGVPGDVILDQWEQLTALTDQAAGGFVDLFETYLMPGTPLGDLGSDDLAQLAGTLGLLPRLARQAVQSALDTSIGRVAGRRLAELVPTADAEVRE